MSSNGNNATQSPAWQDWKSQTIRILAELRKERSSGGPQGPRGDMQRALA